MNRMGSKMIRMNKSVKLDRRRKLKQVCSFGNLYRCLIC